MAKHENTSLAVIQPQNFAIAKSDRGTLEAVLRDNIGPHGFDEFDLDRVKMPAGGGLAFEVPTLGGVESQKEIVGVIIGHGDRRAYWSKPYGEGESVPPDCSSLDAFVGNGNPGGNCAKCPMAAFGSKIKPGGAKGRGQACNQRKLLFIIRPTDMLPLVISCAPTSLDSVKKYMLRLASAGKPAYSVITKFTLTQEKNADGIKYSSVVCEMVADIPAEHAAKFKDVADTMRPYIGKVSITAADVIEQPAGV